MANDTPVRPAVRMQRRLMLLVAAEMAPLTIYQTYELVQERQQRIAAAIEHVQETARTGASRYSAVIDEARSTLRLLSYAPEVVAADAAGCRQFLDRVRFDRPWAEAFFLVDVTGRIACSTVEAAV